MGRREDARKKGQGGDFSFISQLTAVEVAVSEFNSLIVQLKYPFSNSCLFFFFFLF
jgi:hypothetical protein